MPNQTIRTQLEHRSIRAFRPEPVSEDVISILLDAVDRAATSSFYQQRTVIRVVDPDVRTAVYAASGQPYVGGDRGELFIFVVDLYRNARIRDEAGVDIGVLSSTALFLQGVEDVLIGAQNMVVAAESLGLGTVYLGSIGGDPQSVITALKLPPYTFPLVGLLVGHADQEPTLKPRLPREFSYAVDAYPQVADYHQALAGYDAVVKTYYDLRDASKPVDTFTRQIETKPGGGRAEQAPVRAALTAQKLALY
ncbi:nitroreductase [Propionicimonas paludicola]|uniref:Nitroreductase n=1 Tax=Propionicimonas paludicola TaxID=185243 RepID=A0A2A9CTV6_9ACTN|nr:nitroreductase family protein [Propionicimonas paludicola]PFG17571.1 nitroreductase [Propionicimonas paludicola]